MGTSPFSPDDIHAAAGAHHELGPEYSDAVVASFLDKVDREIAARVDAHLAASTARARPAVRDDRRALLRGFALGVASSIAVVLLVAGARPGRHALVLLPILALACAIGALWGSRHRAARKAAPRRGRRGAVGDDYPRWI